MYKKNKSKLYVLSVFFIKSLILFFVFLPVTNFVLKVKKNDLYAQSRRGGSRRSSARSGSVKKKPARSGSSTKKSSARSGSIKKSGSSIRSGSMIRRIGDHSARSGSLSNNLASSSKTTNSNQNQPKTSTYRRQNICFFLQETNKLVYLRAIYNVKYKTRKNAYT